MADHIDAPPAEAEHIASPLADIEESAPECEKKDSDKYYYDAGKL